MIVESQNVQQARQHVLQLAREIEALADAGGPPDQFFPQFLSRLVTVLGAQAGAVWLRDPQGRIGLACEVNLQGTGFASLPQAKPANDKILMELFETGESCVKAADDGISQVPTNHVLLLAPLQKGKEVVGVVEIFQRPDSAPEARPGFLQFMEQMCGHASRYLTDQDAARKQLTPLEFWKQFEKFSLQLQRGLNIKQVAHTAANDGRQLTGSDRVSVALRRGHKTKIVAISGADSVNRRANLVRLLEQMVDRVISAGEPLLYTGQLENLPPQLETPLAEYVHESGTRMIYVVPLFKTPPLLPPGGKEKDKDKPVTKHDQHRKAIGALVVEQVSESRPKPNLVDRSSLIADHTAAALDNSVTHESLFLLPVWRFFGTMLESLRGRTLAKVVAGTVLAVAAIVAMIVVPWDYRVEAKGKLMPVVQRDVFAFSDGQVTDVLVKSGERVAKGQPLVKLRNDDLNAKFIAASNELNEKLKLALTLQAQIDEAVRKAQREEENQLQGKLLQTRIEITGSQEQVQLLKDQLDRLVAVSPIDGVVATFQLDQILQHRPVQRGEVLLQVMEDRGAWRMELEIPEQRMGHIIRQQLATKTPHLDIEFLMATKTDTTYAGRLGEVSTRAALTEGEGSVVEAKAEILAADLARLQQDNELHIGSEVRAKINCGQRALGYVLFGDVIEFVQKRVLLW